MDNIDHYELLSSLLPFLMFELTILNPASDTGDNLHFGHACQQARADGIENVDILPVCDDVSVARLKGALVGRPALAGTILGVTAYSILAALLRPDGDFFLASFQNYWRCFRSRLVFRDCPYTRPGRHWSHRLDGSHTRPLPRPRTSEYSVIPPRTVEIGLGLHNDPASN